MFTGCYFCLFHPCMLQHDHKSSYVIVQRAMLKAIKKGKVGEFSNQAKKLENEANKIPLACYLSFTKFWKS